MNEWKEVRLDSLVNRKICYGIVQPGISPESGIPVIKVNNIVKGLRDVSECDKTTEEINSQYKRTILKGGELVISLVGTVGYVDIVPLSFAGANLVRATGMIDIEDELIKRWVLYYIRTKQGQQYIEEHLNTTVQRALNIKDLCEMPIPITQRSYMEKVVSILSSLDDKIAVNKQICENLEAQAQALFKHWFVDFAPFKDGKFVESELGLIPEGWRVGTFGDVAELRKPSIKPQDNILYTHYSIPAFDNSKKPSIDEGSTIKSNKFGINDGAVLLSKLNPSTKRIWYTGNVPDNSVSSTEFLPFYSKNKEFTPFIYCYLNCDKNYREIANGAKGTTNSHQRIDANSILTRGLAYSEEAIKKFCDCCQYLMELILEANQESSRLATLRDTLLPKLMSGEIKVGDIEI